MYSFDIFNTILIRAVRNPAEVFFIVQSIINESEKYSSVPGRAKREFAFIRQEAERMANLKAEGRYQYNIDHIYNELETIAGIGHKHSEQLKQLEYEIELAVLHPNLRVIARIKKLIENKEKVILISDMYYPEEVIREILVGFDKCFLDIPIYISCDYNATKATGHLYFKIRRIENVEYKDWTHIGDDEISDNQRSSLLGINTEEYLNDDYVEKILDWGNYYRISSSATREIHLISKKYYLKNGLQGGEIEAGIICAPILYDYVKWVIEVSIANNINQLFFLARDGYILKDIADIYIQTYGLDIKTIYLYSSRKAWNPETAEEKENLKGYIFENIKDTKRSALVDTIATGNTVNNMARICDMHVNIISYAKVKNYELDYVDKFFQYYSCTWPFHYIEAICRAPHGATIGYEKVGDIYKEVLDNREMNETIEKQFQRFTETVIEICNGIIAFENQFGISTYFREIAVALMKDFFTKPSKSVADYFGEIPQDDNNINGTKFGPRVSVDELVEIQKGKKTFNGYSLNYTLLRLTDEEKACLDKVKNVAQADYLYIDKADCHEKSIILYGAGKYGREYSEMLRSKGFKIIAWVDQNYQKFANEGLPVSSLSEINKLDYMAIVVAVKNGAEDIKNFLVEFGIDEEKVYTSIDKLIINKP
ncbi:hypothetical protein SAMN04487830_12139 [Pseudobutyrivibrio sp. OR37]|uniref:PglD-related sugar-binding protein n=1 Tax=Pseudobutyrivibrio sp. OR37 TaxID=1798186 RepID=UPI0008EB9274|nr:hypothetical protein [Pseudobutyrivibrio sp. OR37]SFI08404.1 hypothetical protein SAMN04487830_12139 [Pseudobutyrivibrio sp. OR37]